MKHELIEMPDGSVRAVNSTHSVDEAIRAIRQAGGVALYWYSQVGECWSRITDTREETVGGSVVTELPPQAALAAILLTAAFGDEVGICHHL